MGVSGMDINWIYNNSTGKKGNRLIIPRGGATTTINELDITIDLVDPNVWTTPQSEVWTTGSSWSCDGDDTIFVSKQNANLFSVIYALDVNTYMIE